jgi:hypothetical protein
MDANTRTRIRHIFLSPRPHSPLNTVAELLEMSVEELKAEIEDGAIVAVSTMVGVRVTREEMVAAAMGRWEMAVIEKALGREASRGIAGGDPAGRVAGARSSVSERDAAVSGAAGGDVYRHHPFARAGGHGLGACRGVGGGGAVGGGRAAVCGRVIPWSVTIRPAFPAGGRAAV